MRRYAVSVSGPFEDEAVPKMKKQLEAVGRTQVETYDVYPPKKTLPGVVNFHVQTDAEPGTLKAAVEGFENVKSVRTEELDAKQDN